MTDLHTRMAEIRTQTNGTPEPLTHPFVAATGACLVERGCSHTPKALTRTYATPEWVSNPDPRLAPRTR